MVLLRPYLNLRQKSGLAYFYPELDVQLLSPTGSADPKALDLLTIADLGCALNQTVLWLITFVLIGPGF